MAYKDSQGALEDAATIRDKAAKALAEMLDDYTHEGWQDKRGHVIVTMYKTACQEVERSENILQAKAENASQGSQIVFRRAEHASA
jgi:hypothetical protein